MPSAYNDTTVVSQSVSKDDKVRDLPAFAPMKVSGVIFVETIDVSPAENIKIKNTFSRDRDLTIRLEIQTESGKRLKSFTKKVTYGENEVKPLPGQIFKDAVFYLQEGKQILIEIDTNSGNLEFNESGELTIEITPIGRRAV